MYNDGSSRLVASILREIYSASCLIKISPAVMLRRTVLHKVLRADKSPMREQRNVLTPDLCLASISSSFPR